MITKQHLDAALKAWEIARDKAFLEQRALSDLTASHGELIASLRKHGHTWSEAETKFELMTSSHREALQLEWRDMDEKCAEYRSLRAKFKMQQSVGKPV